MLEVTFIFLGLTLNSFVAMMQKGASVKELPVKKTLLYTFLFSAIQVAFLALGYLASIVFKELLPDGPVQMAIAGLICFAVGNYILIHTIFQKRFIEKLDRNFDTKSLLKLAVVTSITTLIIGIGFSLLNVDMFQTAWRAFLVSFIGVFTALNIGYSMGAGYQKHLGITGGVLMIVFSVWLLMKYVLMR